MAYLLGWGCIWSSFGGMRGTLLQSQVESAKRSPIACPQAILHHSRFKNERVAERTLRTEELSGDVKGLGSHDDNLLAVEQLLGDSAGEPTKEVTLGIDRDLFHLAISRRFPRSPFARGRPLALDRGVQSEGEMRGARGRSRWEETHDVLEGRHLVLLHVE